MPSLSRKRTYWTAKRKVNLVAGTPFESLTALSEIEGVARPTLTSRTEGFVGSATAPTKKAGTVVLNRPHPPTQAQILLRILERKYCLSL
jgi:hypothetical protein